MSCVDTHIDTFRLQTFKDYLLQTGAVLQPNTDPWMVIRYRRDGQTHIVYKKKNGRLTFQNQAAFHYNESQNVTVQNNLRPPRKTKRKLLERDGPNCFYCNTPLTPDDITIEHLLARSKGGTNDLANLVLAHKRCNERVGNLSIAEKLRMKSQWDSTCISTPATTSAPTTSPNTNPPWMP